jgi:copper resistance protein B
MRRLVLFALAAALANPALAQEGHEGHGAMDHSAHAGHAAGTPDDSPGNAPAPPIPTDHAADAIFSPQVMERSRQGVYDEMTFRGLALQVDQFEYRARSGSDGYAFEGEAWYGWDIDRAVVAFEGEGGFGEATEGVEIDAYWRHALDPWFNLQVGARQDFRPDPDRTYAMVGIQGLAPYWFEVEGQVFLSNKGDIHARVMASYDQRITQRLILEPELEADFAFQDVPELGIGAGIEKVELSARLRYEFSGMFAPYMGVHWERKLGDTTGFVRAEGEKASSLSALAGVRVRF